ncbi:MAG: hypothetical protein H6735_21480 [Alphaproteobacteria bacterium]|nr:hypothetical protein [Alphaproteobacteria bacterium]
MTALLVCFLQMLAGLGAPISVNPNGTIAITTTQAPAPSPDLSDVDGPKRDPFVDVGPTQISNGF